MSKEYPILYRKSEECCGCGACVNVCPLNAIALKEDGRGFVYPVVDKEKCVGCGLCVKQCGWKKKNDMQDDEAYVFAAVNKDVEILNNSTSGGVFGALARWILDKKGVVYGCAWDESLMPYHRGIESEQELGLLQGSKYVQSDVGYIYREVKQQLEFGKYVLFSGTPCQCAGLRLFLSKKYDKLYCVELICHGVPSARMFCDYIEMLEDKLKGRITDIHFRDKKLGWGALLKIDYKDRKKRNKTKYRKPEESYYYYYFYKSLFFRESCYKCHYACEHRGSDFTIGDYWGAQRIYPQLKSADGVSVLIATGEKAYAALEELREYLVLEESSLELVKEENEQLQNPSVRDKEYDTLWERYLSLGPDGFDKWYKIKNYKTICMGVLKRIVPRRIKNWLRS